MLLEVKNIIHSGIKVYLINIYLHFSLKTFNTGWLGFYITEAALSYEIHQLPVFRKTGEVIVALQVSKEDTISQYRITIESKRGFSIVLYLVLKCFFLY